MSGRILSGLISRRPMKSKGTGGMPGAEFGSKNNLISDGLPILSPNLDNRNGIDSTRLW